MPSPKYLWKVFKIRSYRRAAQEIRELPSSVAEMVRNGEDLQQLPGVGPAISRKIVELVTTGKVRAYERAKAAAEGAAPTPVERGASRQ